MPGLGQVYARAWRPALAFVSASLVLTMIMNGYTQLVSPSRSGVLVLVALFALSLALTIITVADAVRRARTRLDRPAPRWFRSTWMAVLMFGAAEAAVSFGLPFAWREFNIPSGSMEPTLRVGDYLFAGPLPPAAVQRGDVIIFELPSDRQIDYVKRVVGLPGDRVQMRHGVLVLNGQAIDRPITPGLFEETLPGGTTHLIEKQTDSGAANNTEEFVVPPGTFFVMGDNRDNSVDSRFAGPREVGPIPFDKLIGRAGTLYWPPGRWLTQVR